MRITFISVLALAIILGMLIGLVRAQQYLKRRKVIDSLQKENPTYPIIGFFHPESDGGAGGEKVLYQAIKAIQQSKFNDLNIVIYSGSDKKPMAILDHVKNRFGLQISPIRLTFVKLPSGGKKLKPENYPSFTMLW